MLTQSLDNAENIAKHTTLNGKNAYILSQTSQPNCTGDASGIGGGIKSGTIGKQIKPIKGASNIFVEGKLNRPGIVGDPKLWDNTPMKTKQYSTEIKPRAVELLIESQKDYPSLWAAIQAIAPM